MKSFLRVWISIGLIAMGIGLALLIIAAASGARWRDVSTFSMNESYSGVENVSMDISYGHVIIKKGNEFSINADNVPKDEFESYVSNGTWYINEKGDRHVSLFGARISIGNLNFLDGDFTPDITITLPDNFVAGNFNLVVGAGDVEAEDINTNKGEFRVGAGELHINGLTVNEKSTYNVGTGAMELRALTANNITVDGGIGNTEIEGKINGDNTIKCGIGHVGIELDGDREDYSYEIKSGIGEIDVDGDKYHSTSRRINNDNAENNFNLDCGIGNITVDFQ